MTNLEIQWLISTPVKVFFDHDRQSIKEREQEWLFENKNIIEVITRRECFGNPEKNCITVLIHFNKKGEDCR